MILIDKLVEWVRRFDRVRKYRHRDFVYNELCNPFNPLIGDFSPDGRYVFHFPGDQILELERTLASRVRSREIRAFKYAIDPFPGEEHPAVIVYAKKRTREKVKSVLEELGINNHEWRDGNPVIF